jgi:stage III sporulation protein AD
MAEIVKVGALGILGILLAVQFKAEKKEYGLYVVFAVGIIIFGYAIGEFGSVLGQVAVIGQYLGNGKEYISILLKVIGIAYVCEFSAGICKDAGYEGVGEQIQVLGKLSVMMAGLPILFAVIEQMQTFMS